MEVPGVGGRRAQHGVGRPELPLHFRFSGSRVPAINPAWVDLLMDSANTGSGLHLVPEPPYGSAAHAEPPAE
ncbi:hypothetical protein CMMCA002_03085 [Clavibacter michiganensis subsp. michiganensis]|nr:hypothetical protein CMMCA002_03085 [Clavibacter michiganensis subsp. michiganensis]